VTFNKKLTVGGIFCDLEKAFDCINYDTLLLKCVFYALRGKTNKPSRTYLSDTYQRLLHSSYYSTTPIIM
jgi:hypothetical protein